MTRIYPPSYPRRVFVDSSANLALLDTTDDNHDPALSISRHLQNHHAHLFTTNFIIDESYTLIMSHLGRRAAMAYLDTIRASTFTVARISLADEQRAEAILRQYQDKAFFYTDATSFAIMDRLNINHAFAFDDDFRQYGKLVLAP